jgi:alpha-L-arabinofuranosidase
MRLGSLRFEQLDTVDRRNSKKGLRLFSGVSAFAMVLGMVLVGTAPLAAQYKVKVQVDPSKPRAMFFATSIGTAADVWDGNAYTPATIQLLQDAGITDLRYPGNGGIDALYHWSTGAVTNPYSNDKAPDFGADKKFPKVVPLLAQLGTALVTVNYGSNLDGSGGGEPAEAAAWVAYANGKPDNTLAIGKDSKGNDWKTVGYWASLRAASPLAADDGLNALRIGQTSPFGIQLWAIGNEPWNNGFYNNDGAGEPDLHSGQVPTKKEWRRHTGDKRNGPTAYGLAVVQYAKAMKAVDSTILVGASLKTLDPNDGDHVGKNWNAEVLKAACGSMDYGVVSMMVGQAVTTDYKTLDEDDLLKVALPRAFSMLASDLGDKTKQFCPAGHTPQLAITNFGVNSWMPVKHPVAVGLFAANAMATLLETGVFTAMWTPMHSVLLLDDSNHPKPAYYGIKMLHEVTGQGDVFVTASSSVDAVAVHAVKRTDGGLGLLFVDKELAQSAKVTVTVNGYNYATKGTRYDWNQSNFDAGKGITEAPIDGLSATFTVDMPASGITAIVIPKAQ